MIFLFILRHFVLFFLILVRSLFNCIFNNFVIQRNNENIWQHRLFIMQRNVLCKSLVDKIRAKKLKSQLPHHQLSSDNNTRSNRMHSIVRNDSLTKYQYLASLLYKNYYENYREKNIIKNK